MIGTLVLFDPSDLTLDSTSEALLSPVWTLHKDMVPGSLVTVMGFYSGSVDATFRLRADSSATGVTGDVMITVPLTGSGGFFSGSNSYPIRSITNVKMTGQLSVSGSSKVQHLKIDWT